MFTYEIWDKTSEVNRFPADEFMKHHAIREDDQVYLIKQGKRTLCVQTDWDSPYAADDRTIEEMAALHCEEFNKAEALRQQQLDPSYQQFIEVKEEA